MIYKKGFFLVVNADTKLSSFEVLCIFTLQWPLESQELPMVFDNRHFSLNHEWVVVRKVLCLYLNRVSITVKLNLAKSVTINLSRDSKKEVKLQDFTCLFTFCTNLGK